MGTKFLYTVALFTVLSVISCKKDTVVKQYSFGDTFTLKLNECALLTSSSPENGSDSSAKVCFTKFFSDGRCPMETCGYCDDFVGANIQISMSFNNMAIEIPMKIWGCSSAEPLCNEYNHMRKDTLGYRICLLSLEPYPTHYNMPIKNSEYKAKLKIVEI